MDLVPRDHWEHSFGDLLRRLAIAMGPRKPGKVLHIPGLGNSIPVRSGRAALVTAIRALDLPPGARIGVPLFCCPVVFKAILTAGCIVRFIDIDPETFCMSPEDLSAKRSQIDAVVAVHMFGNLCDMTRLKEEAKGKPIIEDCAQALASKIGGRMAGSFGDIAFFSFRSGKYISAGEGGALYSRDVELCFRVSQLVSEMRTPRRTEECAHVAKVQVKSLLRSKPLYGVAGYRLWKLLDKKMKLSENSDIALGQIYLADLAIIKKRLSLLGFLIDKQRANADLYTRILELEPAMLCSEKPGVFYNRYHFPITFRSTEHRDLIAAYLLSRQVDTMKYLNGVTDIAVRHYGYDGGCPVAERLSKRVLVIPSYYTLGKGDIQYTAQCINIEWARTKSKASNV